MNGLVPVGMPQNSKGGNYDNYRTSAEKKIVKEIEEK